MNKKVCILAATHPALDARIFHKEALSLHKAGFEVSLIAEIKEDRTIKMDRVDGPIVTEEGVFDGINIIGYRMGRYNKIFGLPKTDKINTWLHLGTLGGLSFGQDPFSDMIDKGVRIDADIYHCHELVSLYAGIQIKRRLKAQGKNPKLICDVHEFWPAKRSERFREKFLSKIINYFERKSLEYVDYVITANYITRGHLLSLNRFIKTEVLDNCPILSIFQEAEQKVNDGMITICHEGRLSFDRGLKEMLEVMKILKERYSGKARLLIVGDILFDKECKEYFEKKVKEYRIEDVVECTGWLPYEKVGIALSRGNIGIIFMEPTENNMLAGPPNKLYNYMRYGLPIVTVDLPETRRIVLESQCGIVVQERTVDILVDALSMLIDDADLRHRLGENARKAVYEKYNWEVMEKKLLRIYSELTSSSECIMQSD